MGKPGFWDDQEAAAKTSAAHARAQRRLEMFRGLETDVADLGDLAEMAAEDEEMAAELDSQLGSVERRLAELEEARLFSGEYDAGDAVVTVHAGAGGTDSQDWAEILLRMYLRWAERRGFGVEMVEASPGEEAGLKSATFIARGENAYGLFAAVQVWPVMDDPDLEVNDADVRMEVFRASGAGGQHVNKTSSAVRLIHEPTGLIASSQEERSQLQNREKAMNRLRTMIAAKIEEEREAELDSIAGQQAQVGWGSQIRSYVVQPYQMVKDLRTEVESGNVTAVLDGDLDEFMEGYLRWRRRESQ